MDIITKRPKGTDDMLPANAHKWRTIEQVAVDTARTFGYREIRFPTFEHTELFERSVGDTTDVVQKEMYTFLDKAGRSITLRPEGTAGTARAILENGLLNDPLPLKVFYLTTCFRYEKPQKGRFREHHQFGVEVFGASSPSADAELVTLAWSVLERLGLEGLLLKINSIGCPVCRKVYQEALVKYFNDCAGELCETCGTRLKKNPLRILDCKTPHCIELASGAPKVSEFLCQDCRNHMDTLKSYFDILDIPYVLDDNLVRGLDYYTKTVFEIVTNVTGSPLTVCGGGRYDGLIGELGGPQTCGLGFGMGLERLLMVMDNTGCNFLPADSCELFIAAMSPKAHMLATELALKLRKDGIWAEVDLSDKSFKAQIKYADKIHSKFLLAIGEDELDSKSAFIKDMGSGEKTAVQLDEGEKFSETFSNILVSKMVGDLPLGNILDKENY